jgi:hypothetical protein
MACSALSTKSSPLGFRARACCTTSACPVLPTHHVVVCFETNACTTVSIEVSCPTDCAEFTTDPSSASYPSGWAGVTENSWGCATRVVRFDQYVPTGAFIRIRTCANTCAPAGDSCGLGAVVDAVYPSAPKLLRFRIDNQDIVSYLAAVLDSAAVDGCVYVGCAARDPASADCCNESGFPSLNAVPWGAEVLVGPIGTRAWSLSGAGASCNSIRITQQPLPQTAEAGTQGPVTFSVIAEPVGFTGPLTYVWYGLDTELDTWFPMIVFARNELYPYSSLTSVWIMQYEGSSVFSEGTFYSVRCDIYSAAGNCAAVSETVSFTVLPS